MCMKVEQVELGTGGTSGGQVEYDKRQRQNGDRNNATRKHKLTIL